MNFFISILGGLIGILLAIGIVWAIIYCKLKATLGNVKMRELRTAMANAKDIEKQNYARNKNVVGMTNLLEPVILKDFPEFNRNLLFSKCENNLRKILNCIEYKDISVIKNDPDFVYIEPKLYEQISDMKSNNTEEKFDNIEFNRSAISGYTKENGKATIKVSTSLSYYYKTNRKDKKSFDGLKKQTRYTSKFIYVYDESKFDTEQVSFSLHCQNCGAPIRSLKESACEYCMAPVQRINFKAWKMASYKEDYN